MPSVVPRSSTTQQEKHHMHCLKQFLAAVALCCALIAPTLAAQTRTVDNQATVSVTANLTLFAGIALDFGSHFASEGVITSDASHYAAWSGFTDPGNRFALTLTLPTALAKVGGGGNGNAPFSCGSAALYISNTTLNSSYDPHSPASFGP